MGGAVSHERGTPVALFLRERLCVCAVLCVRVHVFVFVRVCVCARVCVCVCVGGCLYLCLCAFVRERGPLCFLEVPPSTQWTQNLF